MNQNNFMSKKSSLIFLTVKKSKGIPRQAEVALGVPGRIFSTFGTTRVVGRQPNAPAAFTPGEIPGTHFQRLSLTQGTTLGIRVCKYSDDLYNFDSVIDRNCTQY